MRIKDLRSETGLTQFQMAELFEITPRTYQNYEAGQSIPSGMKFERLIRKLEHFERYPPSKSNPSLSLEPQSEYKTTKPVPYFELDVSAGNIEMFSDSHELPSLSITIPGFDDCDMALPIYGNSMYPTFESGVIIMCKKLKDKSIIQYGEPHLIITGEQRMVKRIQKADRKETVVAVSDNESVNGDGARKYESFEIPRDKILHLYIVKGCIKRNQI